MLLSNREEQRDTASECPPQIAFDNKQRTDKEVYKKNKKTKTSKQRLKHSKAKINKNVSGVRKCGKRAHGNLTLGAQTQTMKKKTLC